MGFFNFKCKQPVEEIKPLPRISEEKLAKLIKAIIDGKTIQIVYIGASDWADMSPRSLEDFLYVFLKPQFTYVNFRVKPEEVPDPLESLQSDVGYLFNTVHIQQKHIDGLYQLILNKEPSKC